MRDLLEARDARTLGRLHQRIRRAALLIVDELGFVPFDRTGGELLFNLLSERHERRSTLVTTNLSFSEWVEVLSDEKLTTALLDRLAHRAHILTTTGPSYRTRKRKEELGVTVSRGEAVDREEETEYTPPTQGGSKTRRCPGSLSERS